MGKIIGIDLGTTNSVVAVMEGGAPVSSRTRKAAVRLRPLWRLPRLASAWWDRWPSGRPSPTPRIPFSRSSASWAAGTKKSATK